MKYTRFEELPVWKAAIELALKTYDFTDKVGFRGRAGLRNQLERAVLSISNNIAEGFERGTTKGAIDVHLHRTRLGGGSKIDVLFD